MGRRRQIRPLFDPLSEGAAENRQEFEGVDFAGTLLVVAHGSFVQDVVFPFFSYLEVLRLSAARKAL
jgi:hypothetical protein